VARLALVFGAAPQVDAWDAELGLRAVPAGDDPALPPGVSLFALEGPNLVLTALKPLEHGTGIVARVLNPTDAPAQAALRWNMPVGSAVSVRLDEEPTELDQFPAQVVGVDAVELRIPPHALRSVRVVPG
jgi:alpha-mannosidase